MKLYQTVTIIVFLLIVPNVKQYTKVKRKKEKIVIYIQKHGGITHKPKSLKNGGNFHKIINGGITRANQYPQIWHYIRGVVVPEYEAVEDNMGMGKWRIINLMDENNVLINKLDKELIDEFRRTINDFDFILHVYKNNENKNKWNMICSAMDWIGLK